MFGKLEFRVIIVVDSKYAVRFHTKVIFVDIRFPIFYYLIILLIN